MAADTIARVAWKPWESSASRTAPTAASAMMNWGPRVQRRRPARLKRSQKAVDKASRQSSRNSARSPPATSPRSTRMQRLARRESQRSRNSRRTAGGARRPAMRNCQRQSIGGGTGSEWDMMPLLTHSTPDSLMMFPGPALVEIYLAKVIPSPVVYIRSLALRPAAGWLRLRSLTETFQFSRFDSLVDAPMSKFTRYEPVFVMSLNIRKLCTRDVAAASLRLYSSPQ